MNLLRVLLLLAFTSFLAAPPAQAQSSKTAAHPHAHPHEAPAADILQPTMIDGVQVAELSVGPMGYSATQVALQAGVPARLVFTRTKAGGCTHQVQIPAFGIAPVELPVGEAVAIEFTPSEAGTFRFACGMDMAAGTLLVKS